jgi:hypothetical protein
MTVIPFPLPAHQKEMLEQIPGYNYRPCERLIEFYDDLSYYLTSVWEKQ